MNKKDIIWEKTRPDHYVSGKYELDRMTCQGRVAWVVWYKDRAVNSAPTVRLAKEAAYRHAEISVAHAYCTNPDCGCAAL